MRTLSFCTATVSICLGACFPSLPPENADGGADSVVSEDAPAPDTMTANDLSQPEVTDVECESPSDCEGLLAACQVASCESQRCIIGTATDGTTCDDGNLCTENDACAAGVCAGAEKVCAAVSQCHLAGTCEPGTGACSTPLKLDGSACDDGNLCTVTDTCRLGVCVGNGKPAVVDHAIAVVATDPAKSRQVNLGGLVATPSSTWAAVWTETSLSLAHGPDAEVLEGLHEVNAGACELGLVRWTSPTANPRYVGLGGYLEAAECPDGAWADAALGGAALSDDSFVLGGVVSGRLPLANGRNRDLGASTLGLVPRGSFWLARVGASGELLWTVEAQGYLGQSQVGLELPMRTVAANGANAIAFGVPMQGGVGGAELVDGSGEGTAVEPVAGQGGGVIYRVDTAGIAREFVRVTAAPGGAVISALHLFDDDHMAVTGVVVEGGVLNVEQGGELRGQIATGLGAENVEPWVAMLDADGTVLWSWHVFLRSSFTGPAPSEPLVLGAPFIATSAADWVWVGVVSSGPLDGRQGLGEQQALSPSWPTTLGVRTTLLALHRETGVLLRSVVVDGDRTVITSGTTFRGGPYVAGIVDGSPSGNWATIGGDPDLVGVPVVSALDRWTVSVGDPSTATPLIEMGYALRQPLLAASPDALFTAFQSDGAVSTLSAATSTGVLRVSTPAIVVRRLNENSALDCR